MIPDAFNRVDLEKEIAQIILNSVNLKNIEPSQLNASTPLVNSVLGLDSVDVLEVIISIEHNFKVKLENADEGRKYFQTIGTIADFVLEKRALS
ncbi:MAG: acyl carrier protein [Oligoflexia bacterium]|nr:acyl carrier protein [Oligoflexia bacterium]